MVKAQAYQCQVAAGASAPCPLTSCPLTCCAYALPSHPFASQLLMPTCHTVPLLQVPQAAAAAGRWQVRLGWWTGAVGGGRQNWPEAAKVGEGGKGGGGREVRPGEPGSACNGVSGVWAEHGSSLLPSQPVS